LLAWKGFSDVGIYTKKEPDETNKQHIQRHHSYVRRVLKILVEDNLYLEPAKCTFEQPQMDNLGIIINQERYTWNKPKLTKSGSGKH
jgi:hypothetical protein